MLIQDENYTSTLQPYINYTMKVFIIHENHSTEKGGGVSLYNFTQVQGLVPLLRLHVSKKG